MAPSDPKLLTHCPLCQSHYPDAAIQLLGEQGKTRLFHLTCDVCSHSVLAVILESSHGVSSVGLVTDLVAQEVLRFQDVPAVTADDCISAHLYIHNQSQELVHTLMA